MTEMFDQLMSSLPIPQDVDLLTLFAEKKITREEYEYLVKLVFDASKTGGSPMAENIQFKLIE